MAESTLSIERTRLRRTVALCLRYGFGSGSPVAWTTNQETIIEDRIKEGLARFYSEYDWSFLKPTLEIPTYAPYSTGTIAVTTGTATLTTGTWPSWAADGDLVYDGIAYEVASRTSSSVIVLRDTALTGVSGATYSLINARYTLPNQFGGLEGDHLSYRPGTGSGPQYVWIIDPAEVRARRYATPDFTDYPQAVAIRPKTSDGTDGQKAELLFWPPPSAATVLLGRGRTNPDALTSTIVYPYGGTAHSGTITQACLAACIGFIAGAEVHEQLYQNALAISVKRDKEQYSPATIGYDIGCAPAHYDDPSLEAGIWPASGLPTLDI
jgi:hypothetical protein